MDLAASASIPILQTLYREYATFSDYYQFTDSRLFLVIQTHHKLRSLVDYLAPLNPLSSALRIPLKHPRVVDYLAHLQQIKAAVFSAHKQWVTNRSKLASDYLVLHQPMPSRSSKEEDSLGLVKQTNKAEVCLVLPILSSRKPSKAGVSYSDLPLVSRNHSRVEAYSDP